MSTLYLPLEQLRMPVVLISAADDPCRTADVVRNSVGRLRAAKVLLCDSGGHVLLGQEARVRQEVRGFLGDLLRGDQPGPTRRLGA